MPEKFDSQSEILPPLLYQDAWDQLLNEEDGTFKNTLEQLVDVTKDLAADQSADLAWLQDDATIKRRWQHAIAVSGCLGNDMVIRVSKRDEKPDPAEQLRGSLEVVQTALDRYGWVTPGLSFKFVEDGFQWLEKEGRQIEAHMFDVVDLRDMDEPVQLLDANDFEGFKTLSNDEIEDLRLQINERVMHKRFGSGANYSHNLPNGWCAFSDARTFRSFQTRLRFGTPDVELEYDEIATYVTELVAYRKQQNPEYGEFPITPKLSKAQDNHLYYIFNYLFQMRNITEQPYFDSYSLTQTIGSTRQMAKKLVAAEVLMEDDNDYGLTQPFFDYWLANHPSVSGEE